MLHLNPHPAIGAANLVSSEGSPVHPPLKDFLYAAPFRVSPWHSRVSSVQILFAAEKKRKVYGLFKRWFQDVWRERCQKAQAMITWRRAWAAHVANAKAIRLLQIKWTLTTSEPKEHVDLIYAETCSSEFDPATVIDSSLRLKKNRGSYRYAVLQNLKQHPALPLLAPEIEDGVLKSVSCSILERAGPLHSYLLNAAWEAVVTRLMERKPDMFTCNICYDMVDPINTLQPRSLWSVQPETNENWDKVTCDHMFCHECMSKWATEKIRGQRTNIMCPGLPSCSYRLWREDVRTLVSEEHFARYSALLNANYKDHLKKTVAESSPEFLAWLKKYCRPCPECRVIVSKAHGCNDMMCVCGQHFCFECGESSCSCRPYFLAEHTGGASRRDLWQIQDDDDSTPTAA
jgi:hypothetical protein